MQPIPGYTGYSVGEDGSVFSHRRNKFLKTMMHDYPTVHIRSDATGKRAKVAIHNLVLAAFVGPRPEGMQACHNDGNPLNNHFSNLRWDTPRNNQADSIRHGTKSRGETVSKVKECDVIDICRRFKEGERAIELAEEYDLAFQTIYKMVRGDSWTHLPR